MELLPGILAYSIGAYICCVSRVFIWTVAVHWSKIWVGTASQGDSMILALTVVITLLLLFGVCLLVWSIASHINYKFTEKGLWANGAAGVAIATGISQSDWLTEIAKSLTYAS
jgi:hypothetical protein